MKVIIIEDEQLTSEHLERLLLRLRPEIELLGVLETVSESISFLKNARKIDLIFCDIHLADGNSFEIFQQLTVEVPVIFTTAFDQYAIKAFDLNSIAYLLKPISERDLEKALEKYERNQLQIQNLDTILKTTVTRPLKSRFLVKLGEHTHAITTEEIHHFISEDKLVLLVTHEGKRYPVDYTLDELETIINVEHFFRINRKILIHINVCKKFSNYFNSRLRLNDHLLSGDEAIVSRDRVQRFRKWLS